MARMRAKRVLAAVVAAAGCGIAAGCADETPPAAPAPVATAAPAAPAHGGIVLNPTGSAAPLSNDPSAPADTPLCGTAAREANGIGQAVLSHQYAQAGICSSFACYDPATATYIGADGYRHVCR
jgi:hypothetical protein